MPAMFMTTILHAERATGWDLTCLQVQFNRFVREGFESNYANILVTFAIYVMPVSHWPRFASVLNYCCSHGIYSVQSQPAPLPIATSVTLCHTETFA
jgi:hypothetical protein